MTLSFCAIGLALARADVIPSRLQLPEETIRVSGDIYFVHYSRSGVLSLDGGTVRKLSHVDGILLVVSSAKGTARRISLDDQTLVTIEYKDTDGTFNALNDLTAEGKGVPYFSGSRTPGAPGKVYHINARGAVAPVVDSINFANGNRHVSRPPCALCL